MNIRDTLIAVGSMLIDEILSWESYTCPYCGEEVFIEDEVNCYEVRIVCNECERSFTIERMGA